MRIVAATAAALALAAALTWPLPLRLGRAVPGGRLAGDVALNVWALSWIYHQAPREPLALLDANSFHPADGTLALSDLLWGEALLGLPAAWIHGPVAAYGLSYALMLAASALAMGWSVRHLGGDRSAAAVAAITFITLPYLRAHMGHLQLQMVAPFPLLVIALRAASDRANVAAAVTAGAVIGGGAWFGAYYGLFLAIEAVIIGGCLLLGSRRRGPTLAALAGAAVVAGLVAAPALLPHIVGGHSRSVHQSWRSSARVSDLLTLTRGDGTVGSEERDLALPLLAIALAAPGAVALWRRPGDRALLVGLVLMAGVALLLAGGPALTGPVYAFLMRTPGFGGVRAPARFSILTATVVILLMGLGLTSARARLGRFAGSLVAVAVLLGVMVEMRTQRLPLIGVPLPPPADRFLATVDGPGAVLHLPAVTIPDETNSLYMLGSRAHFRPLVNGYSGLRPPDHGTLLKHLAALPDPAALRLARELGVRFVVRHIGDHSEGVRLEGVARRGRSRLSRVFAGGGARVYEIADADVGAMAAPAAPPQRRSRPPRLMAPLPFEPGEQLRYVVTWSGMEAAAADLRIEVGDRPHSLRLIAEAATTRLARALYDARFRFEATIDDTTLLPIEVRREQVESADRRDHSARFDHERGIVITGDHSLPLARHAHDPLTALYALRALELGPPGSVHRLAINDLGNALELEVTVGERRDGVVELQLRSREESVQQREFTFTAVLEEGGARRVREVRAELPIGDVLMSLHQ